MGSRPSLDGSSVLFYSAPTSDQGHDTRWQVAGGRSVFGNPSGLRRESMRTEAVSSSPRGIVLGWPRIVAGGRGDFHRRRQRGRVLRDRRGGPAQQVVDMINYGKKASLVAGTSSRRCWGSPPSCTKSSRPTSVIDEFLLLFSSSASYGELKTNCSMCLLLMVVRFLVAKARAKQTWRTQQ